MKDSFTNNFPIYYSRFCYHLIGVKKQPSAITYLDLSHSMRCLSDVKFLIDEYFVQKGFLCKFPHIKNLSKIKKKSPFSVSVPQRVDTPWGWIGIFGYPDRIIDPNDIEIVYPTLEAKPMSFVDWLGCEVMSTKDTDNNKVPISREHIIRRIANKFSGSHPYETDFKEKEENKFINNEIDQLQAIRYPTIQFGHLLIEQFAVDFALATFDSFLNDESLSVIKQCRDILYSNQPNGSNTVPKL